MDQSIQGLMMILLSTGSYLVYALTLNFVSADLVGSNPTVSDSLATSGFFVALRKK